MKKMKDYKYHIGLKVRGYLSQRQRKMVIKNIGCARFVYNRCVAVDRELHQLRKINIYSEPVARRISFLESQQCDVREICNLAPFLYDPDIDSMALYDAIVNYRKAWKQFHTVPGTSIPTFHKKRSGGAYQTNAHYQKNGSPTGAYFQDSTHIVLPKVGVVRIKGDKSYIESILAVMERQGTFTVELASSGDCYISASLASDMPFHKYLPKTGSLWGFDANVENFLTGSDGERIENPKYLKTAEKELAKQQRKLSRRMESAKIRCPNGVPFKRYLDTCSNYQKQRRKVASIHEHVARQRKDFINRVTKQEVKNHDFIAAEDLKVKNMLKNHCLAKAISDVSWGELFRQLKYKAPAYGKCFVQVPPHYTSQTCSCCGYVLKEDERLTLEDRKWTCPKCKKDHDRDKNSAVVILSRALNFAAYE